MIDISIIIVSYNTKEFLARALNSLFDAIKGSSLTAEVIVIDNASIDQSAEMVEKEYGKVIFIKNKENLGFSKANNIGIKKAKGKYLLFLNPDTILSEKTLERMIEFMEENQIAGAATCKVELTNGKLDDASHRGFPTPWNSFSYFSGLSKIFPKTKIFGGYNLGWENFNKTHQIDACAGAFMMVRRQAGEEIGWWDEDYFFYGEDLDFCYRLKQKGWKIFYVPTVSIFHHKSVSGGIKDISKAVTTATKETKILATNARFEAMEIFYKKHYLKKYPKIVTWLIMQAIFVKRWFGLKNV